MLKKIIPEKELRRQIALIEQLLNHPSVITKDLAEAIQTTERTVFSDLVLIRDQLPKGWMIETSSQGIELINQDHQPINDLWAVFLSQSIGVQLIKSLFFNQSIVTTQFLNENAISIETLRRYTTKINRQLSTFQIRIKVTTKKIQFLGDESAIRILYHRLLTPFTHNNYFFEDYAIHEVHYFQFLSALHSTEISVQTEEIFGTCWFFINTIRIKASCQINDFYFDNEDPLYLKYRDALYKVYEKEGVYLVATELFFAFFCFLESWHYNNVFGDEISLMKCYPKIMSVANQVVDYMSQEIALPLKQSSLVDNLLLLLLKYNESTWLSEQFQLEYPELLIARKGKNFSQSEAAISEIIQATLTIENPLYLLNLIFLLEQQTILAIKPQSRKFYFTFQGEPAWKAFLQEELAITLGSNAKIENIEYFQLRELVFDSQDVIISNYPLDDIQLQVFYISNMPTKSELRQLAELTWEFYL